MRTKPVPGQQRNVEKEKVDPFETNQSEREQSKRAEDSSSYLEDQRRDRLDFHLHPEHEENEFWPITCVGYNFKDDRALNRRGF